MSFQMDKIIIIKQSDLKGEASVSFIDEDNNILNINKIIIDLGDGSDPIKIIKYENVPIVSGIIIEGVKQYILELFQEYFGELEIGVYNIDEEGIHSINS